MASEYLYGKLPAFDAEAFDRFVREAPEHVVKHNCMPTKESKEIQ